VKEVRKAYVESESDKNARLLWSIFDEPDVPEGGKHDEEKGGEENKGGKTKEGKESHQVEVVEEGVTKGPPLVDGTPFAEELAPPRMPDMPVDEETQFYFTHEGKTIEQLAEWKPEHSTMPEMSVESAESAAELEESMELAGLTEEERQQIKEGAKLPRIRKKSHKHTSAKNSPRSSLSPGHTSSPRHTLSPGNTASPRHASSPRGSSSRQSPQPSSSPRGETGAKSRHHTSAQQGEMGAKGRGSTSPSPLSTARPFTTSHERRAGKGARRGEGKEGENLGEEEENTSDSEEDDEEDAREREEESELEKLHAENAKWKSDVPVTLDEVRFPICVCVFVRVCLLG
jgi:hypothetical protein